MFRKSIMVTIFNLLMTLFIVSACTLRARNQDPTTTINKNEKTKIIVTQEMSADDIADAAEQLVTPYTFMLADKTFSLALEKNPTQNKALFYKAFLKRFMAFKGLLARIRPLVEQGGQANDYSQQLKQIPESALKSFLLDGPADITDVYSAQTFLNQYVRSVNYLREFLIQNPELNFTIYLNPYMHKETIQESWSKSCRQFLTTNELMHVECDARPVALRQVNAADLMILRQIAAAEVLTFSFYASYSLEGVDSIQQTPHFDQLPFKTQRKIIAAHRELGALRRDHVMDLIQYIAQDLVAATRWAEQSQKELCPHGVQTPDSREQREGYIFSKGVCLSKEGDAVSAREIMLSQIEKALRGTLTLEIPRKNENMTLQTIIDPLVVSRRPIIDLKSLLPMELPECGKRTPMEDATLGGFFPRGDAPEVLGLQACH